MTIAKEEGILHLVFSNETLRDIENTMPINEAEFMIVNGVGQRKLEIDGKHFNNLIIRYRAMD